MVKKFDRNKLRQKKHRSIRKKIVGTAERPRLAVYRSLQNIFVQVIDDTTGNTLVSASTIEKGAKIENGSNIEAAKQVGERIAKKALDKLNIDVKGATYAVQGFGNVGYYTAYYAYKDGAKIVAFSNTDVAIYNENGIDMEAVIKDYEENGRIVENKGYGKDFTNEELLELEVDVLAPCALENQITSENADRIKAKVITEGANGPTTPEADEILYKKGIVVIPDILANAGGVVVSYFEWVQNLQG